MASLAGLLPKKLTELTVDELSMAAKALKINVTVNEELRSAALLMMQGANLDTVSDLIQSPEAIKSLIGFFQPPKATSVETERVIRCKHCGDFFLYEL